MTYSRSEHIEMVNMCMVYNPETQEVIVEDKTDVDWKFGHTFPGGHVEKGESLSDAIIREVYEETGITVSNLEMCGTVEWNSDDPAYRRIGFLYRTSSFSGEITEHPIDKEGKVFWMKLADLNRENTADSFMEMLEIFTNPTVVDATSPVMNGSLTLQNAKNTKLV
ncbi:NUDIX domain-containing protein [Lentilactobacillus sp. Marseille-Q4993]|uniref:8-oxo-dGTP diphosphatase n=1 Tax=Lentilactobacillus sp. Marseille-Q4993 TaxID=3039492 RepID=UPI0024BC18A7|nr:NUDIX domain-containing protein [Lentilactobacillus sp. Marseille-Q4993]